MPLPTQALSSSCRKHHRMSQPVLVSRRGSIVDYACSLVTAACIWDEPASILTDFRPLQPI